MAGLFDSFQLRDISLRNRIGVSPMCMYSSEDGFANDWHLVHLGARAAGGSALVLTEASAVEPVGRISPEDLGIWKDEHIQPLIPVTRFIESQGAIPGMQLAHAGRKACTARPWTGSGPLSDDDGGWDVVAPSAIPFGANYRVPQELDRDEIADIQTAFKAAAVRALAAGFKWVELHSAHGYLLHQFLSPLVNHRTDEYGGSFENRIRMTMETVAQVRSVWPENLPLSVRLSCVDWAEGGWDMEQTVELSRLMKAAGVDAIDCSSGGAVSTRPAQYVGYMVPFSETVRREADVATMTVGLITEATHADEIIRNGRADIVLMGREVLRDPYFPQRAAKELGLKDAAYVPPQYLRAH